MNKFNLSNIIATEFKTEIPKKFLKWIVRTSIYKTQNVNDDYLFLSEKTEDIEFISEFRAKTLLEIEESTLDESSKDEYKYFILTVLKIDFRNLYYNAKNKMLELEKTNNELNLINMRFKDQKVLPILEKEKDLDNLTRILQDYNIETFTNKKELQKRGSVFLTGNSIDENNLDYKSLTYASKLVFDTNAMTRICSKLDLELSVLEDYSYQIHCSTDEFISRFNNYVTKNIIAKNGDMSDNIDLVKVEKEVINVGNVAFEGFNL